VLAGVQLFRPVPAPTFHSTVATSVRLPGAPAALPWPASGSAALSVLGGGSLGTSGPAQAVPVAGLAKVMTAYVVLRDHPLAPGQDGATITVGQDAAAAYQAEKADQESTIPLAAGETLSELQGLQGLLVASGNDMAVLLAAWDAGGTAAFVAKMNAAAASLGLRSAHFTDPSGLDAGTVGSASDMVRLGEAAMALPAFGPVVAMTDVTLPNAATTYNLDYDLGHDGIVGIKTGASSAAGGCFLFAATEDVGGRNVTVVGAVLSQRGTPQTGAAVDAADRLAKAAFAAAAPVAIVAPGLTVGQVTATWGPSTEVRAASGATVVAWPGLLVPVHVQLRPMPSSFGAGATLGALRVRVGGRTYTVPLQAASGVGGPSVTWRLTRL